MRKYDSFYSYDPDKWRWDHFMSCSKSEKYTMVSNMYPMCYNFSDAVNYSFMVDAKVMATILSAKFNVFKNVEMNPTLLYCHNWKSRRKSVSKTCFAASLSFLRWTMGKLLIRLNLIKKKIEVSRHLFVTFILLATQ